jgi:hypothetical protein
MAASAATQREVLENVKPAMARADLQKQEMRRRVGHAVQRCFSLAGLTQRQAAEAMARDEAQVGRWVAGTERPQFDTILAVDCLCQPMLVALAELSGAGVEVTTQITVRRALR